MTKTPSPDDERIAEQLREIAQKIENTKLIFLIVGKTGVGKSSTINRLLGSDVCPVSHFKPGTHKLENHEIVLQGVPCQIVDTPGLADGKGQDAQYIDSIRALVPTFNCMLFVTQLNFARVEESEQNTIKALTQSLGAGVWEHSVIVFTHANDPLPVAYEETLQQRTALIREEIAKHAGAAIGQSVPSVAVDNTATVTPDGQEWLKKLFMAIFKRLEPKMILSYTIATGIDRFDLSPSDKKAIANSLGDSSLGGVQKVLASIYLGGGGGAIAGTLVAGPIGAGIGFLVGSIGLLLAMTADQS